MGAVEQFEDQFYIALVSRGQSALAQGDVPQVEAAEH